MASSRRIRRLGKQSDWLTAPSADRGRSDRSARGRAIGELPTQSPLIAAPERRSRSRGEIGRESARDTVGNDFRGPVFGIPQAAQPREPLLLSRNVVGDTRESLASYNDLVGRDFGQRIGRVDAGDLHVWSRCLDVHDHSDLLRGDRNLQAMGWRSLCPATGQVEQKRIADLYRQARLIGSLRRGNLLDIHGTELLAHERRAICGKLAVERLKTAGREPCERERHSATGRSLPLSFTPHSRFSLRQHDHLFRRPPASVGDIVEVPTIDLDRKCDAILNEQALAFGALLDRIEGNGVRVVICKEPPGSPASWLRRSLGRGVRGLTATGDDLTEALAHIRVIASARKPITGRALPTRQPRRLRAPAAHPLANAVSARYAGPDQLRPERP